MDTEQYLLAQAQTLNKADPGVKTMIYRNRVKAQPFFASIRPKLEDPAYSAWFLHFSATPPLPNGTWNSPKCDNAYDPPLCSELYHFPDGPSLVPDYPGGPACDPPHCDCGGKVPCGSYVYDWRNANLVINNQSLIQWYIQDVLFGPTGMGAPDNVIKGFFLDVRLTSARIVLCGCDTHQTSRESRSPHPHAPIYVGLVAEGCCDGVSRLSIRRRRVI